MSFCYKIAGNIKGAFSPSHNFSSQYTKHSKYLHLLVPVANNLPQSLLCDSCITDWANEYWFVLGKIYQHFLYHIPLKLQGKLLHLHSIWSLPLCHSEKCMYFIWFILPWTGKEDSLRSQQLSWLWHKQVPKQHQLQHWTTCRGFGPLRTVLPAHQMLPLCCRRRCQGKKWGCISHWKSFPIAERHSSVRDMDNNLQTRRIPTLS